MLIFISMTNVPPKVNRCNWSAALRRGMTSARSKRRPMTAYKFTLAFLVAATLAAPASAIRRDTRSTLAEYVRARAADAAGQTEVAAAGYASVLASEPNDEVLALRAYRQATTSGDFVLALKAARTLSAKNLLPPDGRLVFLGEAVQASNWKEARRIIDQIEAEQAYGFAVPVLRAWVAYGSGEGDPLAALADIRKAGPLASAYASEHRALLLLAMGKTADGVAVVQTIAAPTSDRGPRLRMAAAAKLAKTDKAEALALLNGDLSEYQAARERINAGKPLSGAVDTAATGIGELLVRIAVDVNRERATPLSLTLSRLATLLAPKNAETWLVTSDLLAAAGQYDTALAAIAQVHPDDPLADDAREGRLQILVKQGAQAEALKEALAAAQAKDAAVTDWTRVGEIYTDLKRPAEAVQAYTRAMEIQAKDNDTTGRWSLLLLQGGALDQAGNWPAAKAALGEALKLAPDQPVVLNYLGYAQLERRENLAQAEVLIEKASRLRPDDAAITDSLGWTYFLRGNVPKAIETLERAAAGEPGETTINEHLGDAYWAAGRKYEARYAWRAALVYAEADDAVRLRAKIDGGLTQETAAR
jgi:tetratricopeptide (TPR) repeat protein